MRYFTAEVFSGKLMELEEEKYTERRQKVYTFMKIPREFEKVNCKLKQYMIIMSRLWERIFAFMVPLFTW